MEQPASVIITQKKKQSKTLHSHAAASPLSADEHAMISQVYGAASQYC